MINRNLIRPLLVLALVYIALGVALELVNKFFFYPNAMSILLPRLLIIASTLYAYTMLAGSLFHKLIAGKTQRLAGFYMAVKVVRLLLGVALLIGLVVYNDTNTKVLTGSGYTLIITLSFFAYYFVTSLLSSLYCIHWERKLSSPKL